MNKKTFWQIIKDNKKVSYEDIENYIRPNEYIKAFNSKDFYSYTGEQYKNSLFKYYYEVEEYETESEYDEVFFQKFLDGEITKESYLYYENKFINLMKYLFKNNEIYAFCVLENDIKYMKNTAFINSNDVIKSLDYIRKSSNNLVLVNDIETLLTYCYLTAREIETSVIFVVPKIKAIILNSGLHGHIICEEKLDDSNVKNILNYLNIEKLV